VKVRIGVGTGLGAASGAREFAALIDDLDRLGFDSIWLPEILTAPTPDPLVAMAFTAAHNPHLKVGTTMLLPGRNLVRLAKELATLDVLSDGRLLLTFVPGLPRGPEVAAVGVAPSDRGAVIDEALPLLRRLFAGEKVTHHGGSFDLDEVVLAPSPLQQPLEFWTGGMTPAALERCGRLADGWLPSSCTPDEAARGRVEVEKAAAHAGREISGEHFGVSLAYSPGPLADEARRLVAATRKGVDPDQVVPQGLEALRVTLERFVSVGFSKFVVRPLVPPASWHDELEALADAVLELQR
jgi:probable F420-dependent oxidoreductase